MAVGRERAFVRGNGINGLVGKDVFCRGCRDTEVRFVRHHPIIIFFFTTEKLMDHLSLYSLDLTHTKETASVQQACYVQRTFLKQLEDEEGGVREEK